MKDLEQIFGFQDAEGMFGFLLYTFDRNGLKSGRGTKPSQRKKEKGKTRSAYMTALILEDIVYDRGHLHSLKWRLNKMWPRTYEYLVYLLDSFLRNAQWSHKLKASTQLHPLLDCAVPPESKNKDC